MTAPDGGRLLVAGEAGAIPVPGAAARPYDVALLDLVASPWQVGDLRQRGLVRAGTIVAAFHLDDRVSAEQEMARRCDLWGVTLPADGDFLAHEGAVRSSPDILEVKHLASHEIHIEIAS